MKNLQMFTGIKTVVLILATAVLLSSCGKDDEVPENLDETMDIEKFAEATDNVTEATTVAELEEAVSELTANSNITVPAEVKTVSLDAIITKLEADLQISSAEKQELSLNNSSTYSAVMDRFNSVTNMFGDANFSQVQNSDKAIKMNSDFEMYIKDDYYTAAVEMQQFYIDNMLEPLKSADAILTQKSAQLSIDDIRHILITFVIGNMKEIKKKISEILTKIHEGGQS